MRIYLDVCCLCRPFDDLTDTRVQTEARAVRRILHRCLTGEFSLVGSEVIAEEISRIPDPVKRLRVERISSAAEDWIAIDEGIISRMRSITGAGCSTMDALHIACAERAGSVLLTTDDDLITVIKVNRDYRYLWKTRLHG